MLGMGWEWSDGVCRFFERVKKSVRSQMRVLVFGLTREARSHTHGDAPAGLVALGSGGFGFAVGLRDGGPAAWGAAAPALPTPWPPVAGEGGETPPTPLAIAAAQDTVMLLTPTVVYAHGWDGDGLVSGGCGEDGRRCGPTNLLPPDNAWARVPLPLPPTLTLTSISVGQSHALVLDSHGRVWAWGSDAEGQVGLVVGGTPATTQPASPPSPSSPACVLGPGSLRGGPACAAIAAGGRHSLALARAAAPPSTSAARRPQQPRPPPSSHPPCVFAWGWAGRGQCGPGLSTPCLRVPTAIGGLGELHAPVTAMAAGAAHSLFLAGGGAYWVGAGWASPCSPGGARGGHDTATPTLVTGGLLDGAGPGGDVAAIAAGARHSVALTVAGAVVGWGCARQGGLGEAARAAVLGRDEGEDGGIGPVTLVAGGAVSVRAGWWHTLVEVVDAEAWNDEP